MTGFLRQGEAVAAHDTLERLGAIRCPTLVSVAEDDILVPPRFSRTIASRIPGAELRMIPGAGHGYFLERPEIFNQLSLDFLAGSSSPRTPEVVSPQTLTTSHVGATEAARLAAKLRGRCVRTLGAWGPVEAPKGQLAVNPRGTRGD